MLAHEKVCGIESQMMLVLGTLKGGLIVVIP
jgi:hypothetical protein